MPQNDTTFALSIFPRCDHTERFGAARCAALAHYRLGNVWYCAEHRHQSRVSAYPIDGQVQFGFPQSMNFADLCETLGMPRPDSALDRLAGRR